MGETMDFQRVPISARERGEGTIAYEASSAGVRYQVIGTMRSDRRAFDAYRVTDDGVMRPASTGGSHRTRIAAFAQCEADLADVLSDRAAAKAAAAESAKQSSPSPGLTITINIGPDVGVVPERRRYACAGCSFATVNDNTLKQHQRMTGHAAGYVEPLSPASVERVARRAKYDALKQVLIVLDGWIEGVKSNIEDGMPGDIDQFHVDDIRRMVNDAAREIGTDDPFRAEG